MTRPGAVRTFLDMPLRVPRIRSLEAAADQVARLPLDEVVTDLRGVLTAADRTLTGEDWHRLVVLVSTLHRRAGSPLDLTRELFAAIETARRKEVTHVVQG